MGFISSMTSSSPDRSLDFENLDCVKIPESVVSGLGSAVTIAYWVYGDPLLQPQNDMIFESANAQGERVMAVHLPWSDSYIHWQEEIHPGMTGLISNAMNPACGVASGITGLSLKTRQRNG